LQELNVATAVYTGKLEDNVPHGEGELLLDGRTYKGQWKQGILEEVYLDVKAT
jgi:hypothetical protein